jgi:hypothetical protein
MDNKAREINPPIIEELINETTPEELAKIDTEMTNNKQQTVVEWIKYQVKQQGITHYFSLREILEYAKEMEKQQIINAFCNGDNTDCTSEQNVKDFAEQYYEQTYGGGEQ